jgi:hypothetical protein
VDPEKRVTNMFKLACSKSPFLEQGYKHNICPFHLIYKLDEDEEEYYLDCYDEMHNHVLTEDPRVIPMPRKNYCRPRFPTPHANRFELVKAADEEELVAKVGKLAKERCFVVERTDPN